MALTKGFGSQDFDGDPLLKRRRDNKENDGPKDEDKDKESRRDKFLREKLRPLNNVTNGSLEPVSWEPVSRKRNRDDAFGTQDEEYTTQYGSKRIKLKSDDISEEGPRPVERTDPSLDTISRKRKRSEPNGYGEQAMRGMEKAFQMR